MTVKMAGAPLARAAARIWFVAAMTAPSSPATGEISGAVNPICRSTTRTAGRVPYPTRSPSFARS